jgi:potassium channel subfamily K
MAQVAPERTPPTADAVAPLAASVSASQRAAPAQNGCAGKIKALCAGMDLADTMLDPYVKFTILPWKNHQESKHLQDHDGVSNWDENFTFSVPAGGSSSEKVKLFCEVWDEDVGKDDLIGFATVDIIPSIQAPGTVVKHSLALSDDDDNECGELLLGVQFTQSAKDDGGGTITVFLYKGMGFKNYEKEVVSVEQDKGMWLKAVLVVLVYMAIAAFFYCNVECDMNEDPQDDWSKCSKHWSVIDAVYFAVATLTTVGYGDLFPRSHTGKVFTCFFVYIGIGMIAAALSYLLNVMMEGHGESMKDRMAAEVSLEDAKKERQREGFWKKMKSAALIIIVTFIGALYMWANESEAWAMSKYECTSTTPKDACFNQDEACTASSDCFGDNLGKLSRGHTRSSGGRFLDSFYMACITMTSVGYGDFSPGTQNGRLFGIFWILLGTLVVAKGAGDLAETFITSKQDELDARQKAKTVNEKDLLKIDADASGEISELEYLTHMLVKLRKIDEDTGQTLHDRFVEIDVSGDGTISAEDVEARDRARVAAQSTEAEAAA